MLSGCRFCSMLLQRAHQCYSLHLASPARCITWSYTHTCSVDCGGTSWRCCSTSCSAGTPCPLPGCTKLPGDTCPVVCVQGRLALLQHDYSALSSSLATIQELGRSVAQFRETARQAAARAVADHEVGHPLQRRNRAGCSLRVAPHNNPHLHRHQATSGMSRVLIPKDARES